jgi:hypothetical protein
MRTQFDSSVASPRATRVVVMIGLAFAALGLTSSVIDWAGSGEFGIRSLIISVGLILGLVGNLVRPHRRKLSYALLATSMALLIVSFYR